ncbi:hypothetical protein EXIGLDRAFT_697999 [Exidia glandulosa HHB12029]|uniref:F-box domain-containing protein n=1 Tax=Exidia glandulosa HHB12029 TaxID=1314781 RepID=A0A165MSM4_EXIGL|nr:hypothetical protein EXIGLDRAFT_697999 [Exidia glandulosa HHB12029]
MSQVLPVELLADCLAYCSPADLCSASCASHVLQQEAEAILYRHVVLGSWHTRAVVGSICRRPARATCIRTLDVADLHARSVDLTVLLSKLPKLVSLSLRACNGISLASFPFRLTSLVIHADCDELTAPELARFLETQNQIRKLELVASLDFLRHTNLIASALNSRTTVLPHLQSLRAPRRLVTALIPGRPLQHIAIQHGFTSDDHDDGVVNGSIGFYHSLTQSTAPVLSLSFRCCDGMATLHRLAEVAPQLQKLKLLIHQNAILESFTLVVMVEGNLPIWKANLEALRPQFEMLVLLALQNGAEVDVTASY